MCISLVCSSFNYENARSKKQNYQNIFVISGLLEGNGIIDKELSCWCLDTFSLKFCSAHYLKLWSIWVCGQSLDSKYNFTLTCQNIIYHKHLGHCRLRFLWGLFLQPIDGAGFSIVILVTLILLIPPVSTGMSVM